MSKRIEISSDRTRARERAASHHTTYRIEKVKHVKPSKWLESGGYEFLLSEYGKPCTGWVLDAADIEAAGVDKPRAGDALTIYTMGGLWTQIRGCRLRDTELYFQTEEEIEAANAQERREIEARKRAKFEEERSELDRRFAALPECFRDRIARRRTNNPSFRWEYESYEMFVCEQAVEIAKWAVAVEGEDGPEYAGCRTALDTFISEHGDDNDVSLSYTAIRWFSTLSPDEQRVHVPAFSHEHSGNTAGMAMSLARTWLDNPRMVPDIVGALAPLVGSEAYGDVPA